MSNANQLFRSLGLPPELAANAGADATTPLSETPSSVLKSGSTSLPIGAVADGEFLKRDGNTIVGAEASGGGGGGDGYEYSTVSSSTVNRAVTHHEYGIGGGQVDASLANGDDGETHTFRTTGVHATNSLYVRGVFINANQGGIVSGFVSSYLRVGSATGGASARCRWSATTRGGGWIVEQIAGTLSSVYQGEEAE